MADTNEFEHIKKLSPAEAEKALRSWFPHHSGRDAEAKALIDAMTAIPPADAALADDDLIVLHDLIADCEKKCGVVGAVVLNGARMEAVRSAILALIAALRARAVPDARLTSSIPDKGADDAPPYYNSSEASAWAAGYDAGKDAQFSALLAASKGG